MTNTNENVRRLKEMARVLKAAIDAGNDNAAVEIIQNEDYIRLLYFAELQDAGKLSSRAYAATVGARVTLAAKNIAVAGVRRRALEDRVKALESAIPQYCGTFKSDATYDKNAIITDHSSMWIARRTTSTRPPSDDWQLCVRGAR